MHIAPAPTMFVQPTDKMVERLSKGRIDPLIENCPELKQRVAPAKSRDSNNTITQKNFPGGLLLMVGANSAAGLRSVPIRNLILDEVDAYPQDLDGEGSPIDLAIARTRTFPNHKNFHVEYPDNRGTFGDRAGVFRNRSKLLPCPVPALRRYAAVGVCQPQMGGGAPGNGEIQMRPLRRADCRAS